MSGLYKSGDGGTSWRPHRRTSHRRPGPGTNRIRGRSIRPVTHGRNRLMRPAWRCVQVDDPGKRWVRTNHEERIWGRGDDFAEVKVHPKNKDVIFVANTSTYRSNDAGSTFTAIKGAPGGDNYHTIWINPIHPEIMLLASDQGAVVTVNGGETWSSWYETDCTALPCRDR